MNEEMHTLRSVAQLLGVPYTDLRYAVATNGVIEPTRVSDWYWLCSDEQVETLRQYFAAKTAAKQRRQMLKEQRSEEGVRLMGETRDRLIERLKVPKIWDKEHRVCPRKRCILAVLLYRQPFKENKRYRTISDIAKSLGWNRRTVRDHLAELKKWEYVGEEDGQYDVVQRANYTPLNSGGKEWWADYAWDWLSSEQYADCTEQYVLKVKSEYPDMGTHEACGPLWGEPKDGPRHCGWRRHIEETHEDSQRNSPSCPNQPCRKPCRHRGETTPRQKEDRLHREEAGGTTGHHRQDGGVDRYVDRYWVAVACPERWQELCPGEDRGCYPITADTRRWYQETYGAVRQSA